MSGESFLCEVCGLLIDWEYRPDYPEDTTDEIRWYHDRRRADGGRTREYSSTRPSPHNHVPRLPKESK